MKPKFLLSALIIALVGMTQAQATAYNFSTTIDLSQVEINAGPNSENLFYEFQVPPPSFTLQAGDTISGTISFANGYRVNISGLGDGFQEVDFSFMADASDTVVDSGTFQLLNVTGSSAAATLQSFSDANGTYAIGTGEDLAADSTFSFSGFSYSVTLNSVTGNNVFTPFEFEYLGPKEITIAPEPSTWMLLLGAFGIAFLTKIGIRLGIRNAA